MTLSESELLKEAAALKKQLLRKSNCCFKSVSLKKCEEVASSGNKVVFKKLLDLQEGKSPFENKKFQIKLVIIFCESFPHPDKY